MLVANVTCPAWQAFIRHTEKLKFPGCTCAAATLPLLSWLRRPPTVHTASGSNSQALSGSMGTQTLPVFGCTQKGACSRESKHVCSADTQGRRDTQRGAAPTYTKSRRASEALWALKAHQSGYVPNYVIGLHYHPKQLEQRQQLLMYTQ